MSNDRNDEDTYITKTVYDSRTGLPKRQMTTLDGEAHSPPNGDAAVIHFDEQGRPDEMTWFRHGVLHRDDGPTSIKINTETGVVIFEDYYINGFPRPRKYGVYEIYRDGKTGKVIHEEYAGKEVRRSPGSKPS